MRAIAWLLLGACAGPYEGVARTVGSVQLDGDGLRGGEVEASFGYGGVQLAVDLEGQQLVRDEPELALVRRSKGFGADLGLRVSLFGVLAPHSDHRFERWFDLGASGTIGGGLVKPSRLETFGQATVGGWIELGLPLGAREAGYPVLVLEIHRAAISEWDDATVFSVGFGMARRIPDFTLGH